MPENVINGLSSSDHEIIKVEQSLARKVVKAIINSTPDFYIDPSQTEHFYHLRNEINAAKIEDLPALFDQLHLTKSRLGIDHQRDLPDYQVPYFAHMRLETDDQVKDFLLGYHTFISSSDKVSIIDWRNAPLSKIFFSYQEGDEYEEEINERTLEGRMLMRNILTFDRGQLVEITTPNGVLHRAPDFSWEKRESAFTPTLAGGGGKAVTSQIIGTGNTGYQSPVISALLDREQFEIMTENVSKPILILGGAGSGKTTAALHRLAYLHSKMAPGSRLNKMAVVVPEKGLVKLTKLLLKEMGISDVNVSSYTDWVEAQARNLINGLPPRICKDPPYQIVQLKKHPAFMELLPRYLKKLENDILARINQRFPKNRELMADFLSLSDLPLLKRFQECKDRSVSRIKEGNEKLAVQKAHRVSDFFNAEIKLLFDLNDDRLALFTDKDLLSDLIFQIKNKTDPETVLDVVRHTSLQHMESASKHYEGYDEEKLLMSDGQSIMNSDSDDLSGTIDQEDFAILFELLRLKTGGYRVGKKSLPAYEHLVIDETQDFAPIELSLLKGSTTDKTTLTVSGDDMQQIDPTAHFQGWQSVLERLGIADTEPVQLKTIYRSPKPIAQFAHDILGPIAPRERPRTVKDGAPVTLSHYYNDGLAVSALVTALENLSRKEPVATTLIITRHVKQAQIMFENLKNFLRVKLVLDGEFDFTPGIEITEISQVKGLEFDYVIVSDVDEINYPNTVESRRLLHVAATRAIHQLWMFWIGDKSPVIP